MPTHKIRSSLVQTCPKCKIRSWGTFNVYVEKNRLWVVQKMSFLFMFGVKNVHPELSGGQKKDKIVST